MFRDLYKYRNFIIQSVRNELISRFNNAVSGLESATIRTHSWSNGLLR